MSRLSPYEYKGHVTSVYDGDTITVEVDLGFFASLTMKVRLYGIDTPELRGVERTQGLKVRDWVREKILNKDIVFKSYKGKQGKYGRWLAEIYLPGEVASLNQQLIDRGMAEPFMV